MTSIVSSGNVALARRQQPLAQLQQQQQQQPAAGAGLRQIPTAAAAQAPQPTAAASPQPPGPSGAKATAVANEMQAFNFAVPKGANPNQIQVPDAAPVQQVQAPQLAQGQTGAVDDPFRQQLYGQLGTLLNGGLSRSSQVQQQYENLRPMLQEQYNANVESAGRTAAAFGRGGAGQTQTAFTNLLRQRTGDEQRLLNDLILKAQEQEKADLFQALGMGTDLSRLMSSDVLAREQMGTQRDITGAQLGLQAGTSNQEAALRQALQGQQLGFQAGTERAQLGESAANRALQAGLQGQQLGAQRLNTLDELANRKDVAQIGAGAQMAASQAAANASVQAAMIGASSAEQRQAAQIAFDKELARQNGMLDLARLEEGARQFDTGAAFNQQAFQYGMGRDATSDAFRFMDMLGNYGYLNEPSMNAANQGYQSALGQGVTNYGANAAQTNAGIADALGNAAQLLYGQQNRFPGLDPESIAIMNWG